MISKTNLVSKQYTGNTTFPVDQTRNYFFVVMLAGASGTIEFGEGGGKIPLQEGYHYEPGTVSMGIIKIEATGDYVVNTNASTHNSAT